MALFPVTFILMATAVSIALKLAPDHEITIGKSVYVFTRFVLCYSDI